MQPEHIELTQKRLTIPLDMPAPLFVMEVVSPGVTNRNRDDKDKRAQYQASGISEYWLLEHPESQMVTVLSLVDGIYQESQFQGSERIASPQFPLFARTAEQVLNPEE